MWKHTGRWKVSTPSVPGRYYFLLSVLSTIVHCLSAECCSRLYHRATVGSVPWKCRYSTSFRPGEVYNFVFLQSSKSDSFVILWMKKKIEKDFDSLWADLISVPQNTPKLCPIDFLRKRKKKVLARRSCYAVMHSIISSAQHQTTKYTLFRLLN